MDLNSRSFEPELIDLGPNYYTKAEYEDCLIKLDQIGQWLGGDQATFSALKSMQVPPTSILDVGCGGGQFAIKLAKKYPRARVVGIDLNSDAIAFANRQLATMKNPPKNVSFELRTDEKLQEPEGSYDVVLATLVCHHLNDSDFIDFLKRASKVAKKKVIINDLHRHLVALVLFNIISPLFFPNRLVQHDGPLSIKRSFTLNELKEDLQKAGFLPTDYKISWRWAFRWLIEIEGKGL